jgi:hypothetical protein
MRRKSQSADTRVGECRNVLIGQAEKSAAWALQQCPQCTFPLCQYADNLPRLSTNFCLFPVIVKLAGKVLQVTF